MALLYVVCAAGGYFLQGVVMGERAVESAYVPEDVEDEPEVPAVSPVPVIENVSEPKHAAAGKYSFTVSASVPTGDQLLYAVYTEQDCLNEVAKTLDGKFENIPGVQSATYYVRVHNLSTDDRSEVMPVKGFVQLIMYEKITKSEIERICNSGDFQTAPAKLNLRIATGCQIIPQGMSSEERGVSTIADVCLKVKSEKWKSVTAESIEYDSQNRMKKLVLKVNY